jgi:hypothetical protein
MLMTIWVKTLAGKTLELSVYPTDSVEELKRVVLYKETIRPDQLACLIFEGKHLQDGRDLASYNILPNSIVHLVLSLRNEPNPNRGNGVTQKIIIKPLTGKAVGFSVYPTDSVEILKRMIQDKEGIPPDHQRLIYKGKQLEDDHKVEDYGIRNGSILDLVLRLRGNP